MKKLLKITIPIITILCIVLCSTFTAFASDENVGSETILYQASQANLLATNTVANNFTINNVMNSYAYTPSIWNFIKGNNLNSLTISGDVVTDDTASITILYEISNDDGIDYVREAMQMSLFTGTDYHMLNYIDASQIGYNGEVYAPYETIGGNIEAIPSEDREHISIWADINFITNQLEIVTYSTEQYYNEWYQSKYSIPLTKKTSTAGESVRFQMNLPLITDNSAPKNVRFERAEVLRNEIPSALKELVTNAYNDGYNNGYNNGYTYGQRVGYQSGYEKGDIDGRNDGFEAGRQSGYTHGYSVGQSEGYTQGYQDGLNADNNESYQQGFDDGIKEATQGHENVSAITVLFNGITSTVQGVLNTLFDVQIGNLTLGWVVGVLLGALVVYFVIKVVIK